MNNNLMMQQPSQPSATSSLLTFIGIMMVIGGLAFILFASSLVYEVIYDPASSKALTFVNENLLGTDQMISGEVDGKKFEFKMNEKLQNFSFILTACIIFSIVISIFNSLILTGATLIKQARPAMPPAPQSTDNPPSRY